MAALIGIHSFLTWVPLSLKPSSGDFLMGDQTQLLGFCTFSSMLGVIELRSLAAYLECLGSVPGCSA